MDGAQEAGPGGGFIKPSFRSADIPTSVPVRRAPNSMTNHTTSADRGPRDSLWGHSVERTRP